jgi:cytochrome c oxidase cbb3-type subunit 3
VTDNTEPDADSKRVEIDPVTGHETTGHVWDGIRELNRPLPRWWVWTFYATIVWAVAYMVLYPAIPLIRGATAGVLGYSTRASVEEELTAARQAQSGRLEQMANLSLEEIRADPELMRFAIAGGRSAFLVNCVPCHGSGAAGSRGYPNHNDDDWLWGGTADTIHSTIAHGIRFEADPDTRFSAMPAFGADDILDRQQIRQVAEYVLTLSGRPADPALAEPGTQTFADNCVACHGEGGVGDRDLGAPSLKDAIWLYGSDRETIIAQVTSPNHGVMPAWGDRLDDVVTKQLALYVYALGGGEAASD